MKSHNRGCPILRFSLAKGGLPPTSIIGPGVEDFGRHEGACTLPAVGSGAVRLPHSKTLASRLPRSSICIGSLLLRLADNYDPLAHTVQRSEREKRSGNGRERKQIGRQQEGTFRPPPGPHHPDPHHPPEMSTPARTFPGQRIGKTRRIRTLAIMAQQQTRLNW